MPNKPKQPQQPDSTRPDQLYIVTGKKNGQRVHITERPMTASHCTSWIKDQNVEAYYKDVDLIPFRTKHSIT